MVVLGLRETSFAAFYLPKVSFPVLESAVAVGGWGPGQSVLPP